MMNMKDALNEKFDVVVAALSELNKHDKIIGTEELVPLLLQAYDQILPVPAKIFVKQNHFLDACLEREDEILRILNKKFRRKMFQVVS